MKSSKKKKVLQLEIVGNKNLNCIYNAIKAIGELICIMEGTIPNSIKHLKTKGERGRLQLPLQLLLYFFLDGIADGSYLFLNYIMHK